MSKGLVWLGIGVGSSLGGYLPSLLFHANIFSVWGIVGSTVGGILGVVAVYRWAN